MEKSSIYNKNDISENLIGFTMWLLKKKWPDSDIDLIINSINIIDNYIQNTYGLKSIYKFQNYDELSYLRKRLVNDEQFRKNHVPEIHQYIMSYDQYQRYLFNRSKTKRNLTKPVATMVQTNLHESKMRVVSDETKIIIAAILEEHFTNGIRPNSIIDINKLKRYYHEATNGEIISEDIDIPSLLNVIGIRHDEKVFSIPASGKKGLVHLLDRLISKENRLFFYDEFFDIHADFFQEMHIFSSELLKTLLPNILPSFFYLRSFFSIEGNITVESEVLRCYETAVCLSYDQVKAKLLYVPLDKIKQVLAQYSDFIWVAAEVYTHVSKVEIAGNDRHIAEDKVKDEIAERGYASLASLDVLASLELNPDLSETAVKNGLYQICFAGRYEKRGNIIAPKGKIINSVSVFRDYCLTHDHLMVYELLEFEKEINGSVHSQSLSVAYDTMVRVDKDTFVRDSEVSFDIEATDNALALFIHTGVIPLQAVTSFTSFPYINGYPWNLYLLESYCKRFSKHFMYQCLSVNSRNVGAIFRRSAGFTDYIDVLAAAVAATNIQLNEKVVGDFLFENRYVAQRTGSISKVTSKARILRERKV